MHLCKGTPLQPLWLEFLLHPCSNLQIDIFQAWKKNKGKVTAPINEIHHPTSSPLQHFAPTHLPIINHQGKRCAIPRCRVPLEDVPIDLVSIDLVSTIVIFFVPCATPSSDIAGRLI